MSKIQREDTMFTQDARLEGRVANLELFRRLVSTTGGGGVATTGYVHTQTIPTAVWNVTHNLGKFPSVDVVDSGNSVVVADVHHIDTSSLTVTFGSATSGRVFCN